jgi:hypothetical protein
LAVVVAEDQPIHGVLPEELRLLLEFRQLVVAAVQEVTHKSAALVVLGVVRVLLAALAAQERQIKVFPVALVRGHPLVLAAVVVRVKLEKTAITQAAPSMMAAMAAMVFSQTSLEP